MISADSPIPTYNFPYSIKPVIKIISTLLFISASFAIQAQDPFVSRWKTDNPGTTNDLSITIPTTGTGYSYDVDWESDGTYDDIGVTGSISHEYKEKGTYAVSIKGDFPRIYISNTGDRLKLITIEQWGDIAWSSMERAFMGASNLFINAGDFPNLSNVTDMSYMFFGANTINSSFENWDVSSVTNMNRLFFGASSFKGPIETWDVGNVEDMTFMFYRASVFNGLLNLWNVEKVTEMGGMFQEAILFNGDISTWKVDSVANMSSMFREASAFNRDISGWNTISLTSASSMFQDAIIFNQAISMWDMQDVLSMTSMFRDASAFNQNLGNWNIENVGSMSSMLSNTGLTQNNYDQTLIGWASQDVQSGISLGAHGLEYCLSQDARTYLDNDKFWTISGDTRNCYFKTTWITDNPGTSGSTSITIPTFSGETYNYDVDWDDDGTFDEFGITGSTTHNFGTAGNYKISIRGDFPRIYFNNSGDKQKIISIDAWGDVVWTSMENAFYGCDQMFNNTSDVPDLSQATNMSGMFREALSIEGDLAEWNISSITNMTLALSNTALSIEDYDNTLISWVAQNTQSSVSFGVQGLQYCLGESARDQLIADGWVFAGDSKSCNGIDRPLILTVKTDNPGISGSTFFRIQTWGGTSYNYDVDIGNDGSYEYQNETLDITVAFPSAGIHQIAIRGSFPRIFYNNEKDKDKIISIDQWGDQVWINMANAFHGCSNLEYNATDAPNLSQVTDMSSMFSGATLFNGDLNNWEVDSVINLTSTFAEADAFNGDISNWNVSNVVQMASTFRGADNFNQNLGNWNMTSATTLFWMLRDCGMSISNYDQTLIGWATQNVNSGVPFSADNLQYCAGEDARNTLINTHSWNITGDSKSCTSFITVWNTNNPGISNSTSVTIPTFPNNFTYNYDVDWNNDGNFEDIGVTGDITHDYGVAGIYSIAIRGQFPSIYFNNTGDHQKIIRIDQWGEIQWEILHSAFEGTVNMTYAAIDTPDLSGVTIAYEMFRGASLFDGDLSGWDVSNITSMTGMFWDAISFNGDISTWEVIQVSGMREMFRNANNFNVDLNSWDVDNVTSMYGMFDGASAFNQNLNSWVVSKVNSMQFMFKDAISFNGNISSWDTEFVTEMGSMFHNASSFNSDISEWKVNNVQGMHSMFKGATAFNSDISSWIVNSVTTMNFMFNDAISFNQDLSNWHIVSQLTTMMSMFNGASSFTSNLGNWDISDVTVFNGLFNDSGMTTQDYDNTLIGWVIQNIQTNLTLNSNGLTYCNGENARDELINNHQWTIQGDDKDCTVDCGNTINEWIGPASGNWHDSPSNWSEGVIPDLCYKVIIRNGNTITIPNGMTASCYTIEIENGAALITNTGGMFNVIQD